MILSKEGNWWLVTNSPVIGHTCPNNPRDTSYFYPGHHWYSSRLCKQCGEKVPSGLEAQYHIVNMIK